MSQKNRIGKSNKINREYFQIGKILDDPYERRQKKRHGNKKTRGDLFGQMAALDADQKFSKRKFQEIQTKKMETSRNKKWDRLKRRSIKKKVFRK